jgi:Flp pilus assembly protein TadD
VAQGQLDRAATIVADAQASRPDSIDLLAAQAEVLHARGDTAGGRAVLEQAVAKRAGSVALLYALAGYEDRTGNPAAAAAHAEVIVAARPDHVAALNLAGYALAKTGTHLDRAETYLLHARELAPGDPALLDSWGWFLYRSKRLDEAEAAIAHASRLAPNQAEILWHLGEVQAARGDRASARTALDSARAAHPDPELLARIEARLKAL